VIRNYFVVNQAFFLNELKNGTLRTNGEIINTYELLNRSLQVIIAILHADLSIQIKHLCFNTKSTL
jgi:hypothetical protein